MIFLSATTHILELATSSAANIECYIAYGDYTTSTGATTFSSQRTAISSATSTTVLAAPASGDIRKVKSAFFRNKHASLANSVTLKLDISATETEFVNTTLQAGQTLQYIEGVGFFVFEPLGINARSRTIIVASGTYTTPAGVRSIFIECIGGAGGGGGVATAVTNSGAAGGGGSGAYSQTLVQSPSATYSTTIGAAGSAGTSGANNGGNGGDTIFGSVCTAKGGTGGGADTVATIHTGGAGGAGGIISTGVGDLKFEGESGGDGLALAAAQATSGAGGRSFYGPGGQQRRNSTGAGIAPLAANGGGGGGGAAIISGGASQAGAAGSAGLIVVTEML